eukprot:CAMPEP_0114331918 /NCGR_PEP_ID=MMETSP0101-20121206/2735_1 /TAXON_ID=38822 ORGANISM="Pteridomonas danica, Strain PT" /NCGR_SAMPLE_ID=MMETSP0101 /ASSEMBLY_ACC=CAM_ASM_000211 /LENGTH=525 /DNA_ID=CAMNT_0001462417 /DNA_START=453 /DNA_END=2030 /DNA_ORIENTATION=+
MNGIQDRSDRESCIELAFQYFPDDVEVITRSVVENIRMLNPPSKPQTATTEEEGRGEGGDNNHQLDLFVSPKKQMNYQNKKVKPNDSTLPFIVEKTRGVSSFATEFQSMVGVLSNEDVTKIKAIEWLCISNEHKPEAVAQSNELLRDFFNCSSEEQSTNDLKSWRIDAAELLVQSSRGISDTTPPVAFPTQVLSRMEEFTRQSPECPSLIGGRSGLEWARVLKEHQCWRVLLNAHQSFMSWHQCLGRMQADSPPITQTPPLKHGASQEEIEEHSYLVRRDDVKNIQLISKWLAQTVGEMEREVERACVTIKQVLNFEPTEACYGPCFGEIDYGSSTNDMLNLISACGMDPSGWMIFSEDHLLSDERLEEIDEEEAKQQDEAIKLMKNNNEEENKNIEKAQQFFIHKTRERDQKHMDRNASQIMRREVLPKLLIMLHEVYYNTSNWLMRVASLIGSFSESLLPHVSQLEDLSVNHLRSSLQVADIAASRQLGLYTCMNKSELRRFLAAIHQSSMKLCEHKGEVSLE